MQLVAADIDGIDVPSTGSQQHVGEAAGGRADIEADEPGRVEAERVQRGLQLQPAA